MVAQVQNFVKLGQTFYIRLNFRDFFLQLPIVSYIDREKKEPPWTQKQLLENINRICNLFHLLIDRPLHFSAKGQLQLLTRHPPSFGPTHQVPMQRRKACQVWVFPIAYWSLEFPTLVRVQKPELGMGAQCLEFHCWCGEKKKKKRKIPPKWTVTIYVVTDVNPRNAMRIHLSTTSFISSSTSSSSMSLPETCIAFVRERGQRQEQHKLYGGRKSTMELVKLFLQRPVPTSSIYSFCIIFALRTFKIVARS